MKRAAAIGIAGLTALGIFALQSGVLIIRGEEATLESGDVRLAASLALPRWKEGPYPAAVIVHGSGRDPRAALRRYGRRLSPHGLAVLMYDKRGTGESTGSYSFVGVENSEAALGQLADDALAGVRYLRTRSDIDPRRIGLIGASQAGWIMPLAASRSSDVAFIVTISGPAVTVGEEIHYSRLTGDDSGYFEGLGADEVERRLAGFEGPHGYDPVPFIKKLSIPSLWILGDADRSVPTARSVANLVRIGQGRPGLLTVSLHPHADHALHDTLTGRRIDYWPEILAWLEEREILP